MMRKKVTLHRRHRASSRSLGINEIPILFIRESSPIILGPPSARTIIEKKQSQQTKLRTARDG